MSILNENHVHLVTRSLDGSEYGNAVFTTEFEAAVAFTGIAREMTHNNTDANIIVGDVMESFERGQGMYAGAPGFILVVAKCGGNCNSPAWN
jgi:hypothetical protein